MHIDLYLAQSFIEVANGPVSSRKNSRHGSLFFGPPACKLMAA